MGVNILEDARHGSVLYICKYFVLQGDGWILDKLVERLLAAAALWVQIQTTLKNATLTNISMLHQWQQQRCIASTVTTTTVSPQQHRLGTILQDVNRHQDNVNYDGILASNHPGMAAAVHPEKAASAAQPLRVQCQFNPDRCVPDQSFLDIESLWQSVPLILFPWLNHPLIVCDWSYDALASIFIEIHGNLAINTKSEWWWGVRSLSVSFFIEKEPHKQLRMKRKRKGER